MAITGIGTSPSAGGAGSVYGNATLRIVQTAVTLLPGASRTSLSSEAQALLAALGGATATPAAASASTGTAPPSAIPTGTSTGTSSSVGTPAQAATTNGAARVHGRHGHHRRHHEHDHDEHHEKGQGDGPRRLERDGAASIFLALASVLKAVVGVFEALGFGTTTPPASAAPAGSATGASTRPAAGGTTPPASGGATAAVPAP